MTARLPHIRETQGMLILSAAVGRVESFFRTARLSHNQVVGRDDHILRQKIDTVKGFERLTKGLETHARENPQSYPYWEYAWDRYFNVFLQLEDK